MDTVTIKIIVPTPKGKEISLEIDCETKFDADIFATKIHLPEQYFYFSGNQMIWSEFDIMKRYLEEE